MASLKSRVETATQQLDDHGPWDLETPGDDADREAGIEQLHKSDPPRPGSLISNISTRRQSMKPCRRVWEEEPERVLIEEEGNTGHRVGAQRIAGTGAVAP